MKIILNILLSLILIFSLNACSSSKKKNGEDSHHTNKINPFSKTERIQLLNINGDSTIPYV